jgi:hypothetical protein
VKAAALDILAELDRAGAITYIPRSDRDYAVTLGLELLRIRHLVQEEDGLLRISEANRHVLDYYANSIEHLLPPAEGSAEPRRAIGAAGSAAPSAAVAARVAAPASSGPGPAKPAGP